MKIVKLPIKAYDIQCWNHGVAFKCVNHTGDMDSNGFFHEQTGLFKWKDFSITHIYYGLHYCWVILKENKIIFKRLK